jgi:hypothetical protein
MTLLVLDVRAPAAEAVPPSSFILHPSSSILHQRRDPLEAPVSLDILNA